MSIDKLPKPIRAAIPLKWPLRWKYYDGWPKYRTARSGYALYAVTGHYENGRLIERKLYVTGDKGKAREVSKVIDQLLGSEHVSRSLEKLLFDMG